jgi:hypothetical protein
VQTHFAVIRDFTLDAPRRKLEDAIKSCAVLNRD